MADLDAILEATVARPGDTLVFRVDHQMTKREFDLLMEHWESIAPQGLKAVFVTAAEMVLYRPLDREALAKALAEGFTAQEAIDIVMRNPLGGTDG